MVHTAARRAWWPTLAAVALLVAAMTLAFVGVVESRAPSPPTYRVFAIRYATIPNYPLRGMIPGVDSAKHIDLAMMVWLLKGSDGHNVLVDAGFHRADFVRRYHPADFLPANEAVERAGVSAADISDVIISHIHWDHLDGIDLFPKARVWIQREEFEHYTDSSGTVKDGAIDAGDAKLLAQVAHEGRLMLIDGDAKEIIPGITVYTGGKHTFASQFAAVNSAVGTIVVASDNAYLYANLEGHRPIAQTLDSLSNLRAQARMLTLASNPRLIVPGHDAEVFVRFPSPGNGVAEIK